ncbi:hypothetical protein C4577_07450 [Candidatus Parcubacteria bacterium]|nr:MAG: hypothetical protein C4577_07450 [Candidatus Parcubacteria bacterium]
MITLDKYQELVRLRDNLRRKKDQAQGAYDQIISRFKSECDAETAEEAQAKVDKINKKIEVKMPVFETAEKAFWDKWGETLEKM